MRDNLSTKKEAVWIRDKKYKKLQKEFIDSKYSFSIKRVIVGGRGSGKTALLKELMKTMKHYYVIDVNEEYDYLPDEKRFCVTKDKNYEDNVINEIIKNKDKVIIIDDAGLLSKKILDTLIIHNDFIVAYQSKKMIEKRIDEFDFIYDLGTLDKFSVPVDETKIQIIEKDETNSLAKNAAKAISRMSFGSKMLALTALGVLAGATAALLSETEKENKE